MARSSDQRSLEGGVGEVDEERKLPGEPALEDQFGARMAKTDWQDFAEISFTGVFSVDMYHRKESQGASHSYTC